MIGKEKPSIAIVLGKPPKEEPSKPEMEEDDEDEGDMEVSEDHILAMKAFEKAKSPEEKAKALLAFVKCC